MMGTMITGKLRKFSYFLGLSGMGLVFAGIKVPILALAGLGGIVGAMGIYTLDKYLCNGNQTPIEDIRFPEEPDVLFRPEEKETAYVAPRVDVQPPITYQYDVISGQWYSEDVRESTIEVGSDILPGRPMKAT